MNKNTKTDHHNNDNTAYTQKLKKAYVAPQWIDHGDVRDVTLGGSPGVGESGQATIFRP